MKPMTPKQRVETALRGEWADHVPFTVYGSMIPQCAVERELRNQGVCILGGRVGVMNIESPNVTTETYEYTENGATLQRAVTHTPKGDLTQISRPAGFTSWKQKFLFSGPEDYEPLKALYADQQFTPNYDAFLAYEKMLGDDFFIRSGPGYSPLQEILYRLMGAEQFAVEWFDRQDEMLALYDTITACRRRAYPVLAKSPVLAYNYGGNVSPEIMGVERFEKYIVPHYEEFADICHEHGKLMGVHMDANNKLLAPIVARTKMDYVEAFTPPPDCDFSVAEARAAWPGKVLWINFPSSVHLQPPDQVEAMTRQLLDEASPGDRFLVSITEDVPEDKWQQSFLAISRVLINDGRLPLGKA